MKLMIDIPDNELKDPLKNIHLLISNEIVTEVCIKKYDKDKPYFMNLNYAPFEECDDCIRRQAAIDACLNGWNKDYKEIVKEIRALPPVTPQYTEAEIQKMQDLEFAEIQKAYEIGKEEGSIGADVLDKIRTEIMDINVVRDEYSQRQNDYCDGVEFAKRYVLQIIDKYKASPTGAERGDKC